MDPGLIEKKWLFSISTYIQKRRGSLRKYIEIQRKDLLQEVNSITRASKNANKILLWKENNITKEDVTTIIYPGSSGIGLKHSSLMSFALLLFEYHQDLA